MVMMFPILDKEVNLIPWKLQMLPTASGERVKVDEIRVRKLSPSYIAGSTRRALKETLS